VARPVSIWNEKAPWVVWNSWERTPGERSRSPEEGKQTTLTYTRRSERARRRGGMKDPEIEKVVQSRLRSRGDQLGLGLGGKRLRNRGETTPGDRGRRSESDTDISKRKGERRGLSPTLLHQINGGKIRIKTVGKPRSTHKR